MHMKILVAIDDSKFSQAAVQEVIALRSPREVEVRVVHIIELWPVHFRTQAWDSEISRVRQDKREEAERLLAHTAQQLRAAGDPKVDVIDVALKWHANLIILGSHGREGLDRFLMGSVSEAVALHAPCSVQIVRISQGESSQNAQPG
jgi:nucleotide-binding universal stress UspA family protein